MSPKIKGVMHTNRAERRWEQRKRRLNHKHIKSICKALVPEVKRAFKGMVIHNGYSFICNYRSDN